MSNAYAIVIGIENYQQPAISGVTFAHRDAHSMAAVFQDCFGVPKENVKIWLDQDATYGRVKNDLKYESSQLEHDDKFYFFYAGHGYWSGDGGNRLTMWDSHPGNLEDTTVSLEEILLTQLRKARCKTSAIFIDACAAKIKTKGKARDLLSDMRREEFIEFAKNTEYSAAFFSCSPEEKSWSWPELKHGVWTYHLERALRGQENAAVYQNKYVTGTSLQNYLLAAVRKFTRENLKIGSHQTPYAAMYHNGTFALVELPEPATPSDLPLIDPDFSEAYFVGRQKIGYKWLPGFNKKIHSVPYSNSEAAAKFARSLLSSSVSEELQTIVSNARDILKLKFRELKKNDDEQGSGTVDADAFRFAIQVDQDSDDFTDAVLRREIRLRMAHAQLPENFDGIFPKDVDTLVVPLRNTEGRFNELRDAIEDRGLDIEDANETTQRIKVRLGGGARITIDMRRGRMTVRIPATSGALSIIQEFDANGGPALAGPTPKLIGKKEP